MRHSQTLDSILRVVAVLLMLVSLFNENVTLATGDYRRTLLTALVTMVIADLICLQHFLRASCALGRGSYCSALIIHSLGLCSSRTIRMANALIGACQSARRYR
jgi:hypothetical protein